ncbi:HSP20-like chaperones superfamily protein [Abeliophyllum distichum]|uniref:HSP20-like chaperones superfamily protein n=1 Tax=Abeliophyllum distichum TaxID=126358 RepID=A0ABD1VRQ0_9LAMI
MESNHLSTLLSMDSSSFTHDEIERELNRAVNLLQPPPDINLPLSAEPSPLPQHSWNDACEMLEVSLGPQHYEVEMNANTVPKGGKKCANVKRLDSVWGAWFFFNFYFKPVLNEKSKGKFARECNGVCSGYDKSDLKLDVFLVQHDMENIYMWVFKERPENALGKMQLRSFMNGHSRQGERPFPFSVEKGFRSIPQNAEETLQGSF